MTTDQGVWKCVIRAPEDLYSSVVVLIQVLILMRWQYCDTVSNIIMLKSNIDPLFPDRVQYSVLTNGM